MKVVIGADKGGFILKEAIASRLAERGIEFEDVGTISLDACRDFVSVAEAAAGIVSRGEAELGILLCGTGMGMAITANKFKGVRAAVVESQYAAEYARKIDLLQRELVSLLGHHLLNGLCHNRGHGCEIGLFHLISFHRGLATPPV